MAACSAVCPDAAIPHAIRQLLVVDNYREVVREGELIKGVVKGWVVREQWLIIRQIKQLVPVIRHLHQVLPQTFPYAILLSVFRAV